MHVPAKGYEEMKLSSVDRSDTIDFIRKTFQRAVSPFIKQSNISDFLLEQMDCDTFLIYAIQPDCLGLVIDLDEFQKIMADLQFLWKLLTSDDPVPRVLFTELMSSLDKLLAMLHQDDRSIQLRRMTKPEQRSPVQRISL